MNACLLCFFFLYSSVNSGDIFSLKGTGKEGRALKSSSSSSLVKGGSDGAAVVAEESSVELRFLTALAHSGSTTQKSATNAAHTIKKMPSVRRSLRKGSAKIRPMNIMHEHRVRPAPAKAQRRR